MAFKNKRKNYNLIMALTLVEDLFQFISKVSALSKLHLTELTIKVMSEMRSKRSSKLFFDTIKKEWRMLLKYAC